MPKLLIDAFMAEKLSYLFTLYVRKRQATTAKDPKLSKKKIDLVGRELERCREISINGMANEDSWESHLERFKKECQELVSSYDQSTTPVNSPGELVTGFIEEAILLLQHTRKIYTLFGLANIMMDDITSDALSRQELLALCMARLYYPRMMSAADWGVINDFCTHMMGSCEVSLGTEVEGIPSFKEYAPLEVAANKWLKKEESAMKISDSCEQQSNSSSAFSTAQSMVVYTSTAAMASLSNAFSSLMGRSPTTGGTGAPILTSAPGGSHSSNENNSVHNSKNENNSVHNSNRGRASSLNSNN